MSNRYSFLLEADQKPIQKSVQSEEQQKSANPQVRKSASPQADMSANPQTRLSASPQAVFSSDKRERYSTRLLPETVKAMKRYALEHDIKDYEVVEKGFKLLQENDKVKSPQVR